MESRNLGAAQLPADVHAFQGPGWHCRDGDDDEDDSCVWSV